MNAPAARLLEIQARLEHACRRAGRNPADVTLIAVTKGQSVDSVRKNILAHGHSVLGESRIQEWRDKAAELPGTEWHLIGN